MSGMTSLPLVIGEGLRVERADSKNERVNVAMSKKGNVVSVA